VIEMPKKSEYDLPKYESRTYRIPMNDESMMASLRMLKKISDVDVYFESDPHTIGISKVTVGTYGDIPLPKSLGKYRHDYKAWKPYGELGSHEDIEYKIVKAGGKDKYGRDVCPIIKYRGTTRTFDQFGFEIDIPVEGEVSPEDCKSLSKDPQKRVELIQELIGESIEWDLDDALQEHPEWFGYGEEEEEEESYGSNNPNIQIPMSEKEVREARRSNIPDYIIGKMSQGFELNEREKEKVHSKGKVYVLAHSKERGRVKVKPQLRDLPKGSKSMRLVATPRLNKVEINGKSTTYYKKFNSKNYSFNSSHYSKKEAMDFVRKRKRITGYDNRIVKFADRYLVYTGK